MKKFSMKFIAGLLSVLLVIMSLPVSAFAIDLSGDTSPPTISQEEANHDIVEIVDMRTATDKYYRLDDGSYLNAARGVSSVVGSAVSLWNIAR